MLSLRLASLVLLLPLLAGGCARREAATGQSPTKPAPLRKVVLQTDWFPQAEHGGYYQAFAKGYYEQAGIDVDIWSGGPGAGIKLKVVRGDADFGMMRSDDLILAAGVGMPVMIVAATMQHDAQGLMVHDSSPVRTFKDLDGRTVIGNVGMAYFPYLEKKFGITIQRRQNTYGLGEFLANPDTVQQCLITSEPFFAEQNGRKVRTLALSSSGYDCYQMVFTRRELVRSSPDVVRGFVQASIRGWKDYLENDPAPANALILKRNPQMTRELLAFSRGELIRQAFVRGNPANGEDIGQISLERLTAEMNTLLSLKILERPVDISSIATNEFCRP